MKNDNSIVHESRVERAVVDYDALRNEVKEMEINKELRMLDHLVRKHKIVSKYDELRSITESTGGKDSEEYKRLNYMELVEYIGTEELMYRYMICRSICELLEEEIESIMKVNNNLERGAYDKKYCKTDKYFIKHNFTIYFSLLKKLTENIDDIMNCEIYRDMLNDLYELSYCYINELNKNFRIEGLLYEAELFQRLEVVAGFDQIEYLEIYNKVYPIFDEGLKKYSN